MAAGRDDRDAAGVRPIRHRHTARAPGGRARRGEGAVVLEGIAERPLCDSQTDRTTDRLSEGLSVLMGL